MAHWAVTLLATFHERREAVVFVTADTEEEANKKAIAYATTPDGEPNLHIEWQHAYWGADGSTDMVANETEDVSYMPKSVSE